MAAPNLFIPALRTTKYRVRRISILLSKRILGPSWKLPGYLVLPVVSITYGGDARHKAIRGFIETVALSASLQQIKGVRGVYHQRHRVSNG
ncbi:hypothetical protein H2204_006726 [Knufia peltigerae]|uniref:Uncharacterized protein n=1 Tax=Knufia peltigerae TaxID=1002370 RepID=A0AA38Y328_9EURO|nr:hypothetical protein H2204_006726 [Knufia peltigerae]